MDATMTSLIEATKELWPVLSDWERKFVADMDKRFSMTEKQENTLATIYDRARFRAKRPEGRKK